MVIQSFWPKDHRGSVCNGGIRVNSEFCSTTGSMRARYVQGMSLPIVGWGGQDNSLPKTHQHPFALLNAKAEAPSQPKPVHLVGGRRRATPKNPT